MWKETKKEIVAREDEYKEITFYSDSKILDVNPSCNCTEATVNDDCILTLKVRTGKIAYGTHKLKKVTADVKTENGETTRISANITVYKDEHYPISID